MVDNGIGWASTKACLSVLVLAFLGQAAGAVSAPGLASATVVTEIDSLPTVIRFRAGGDAGQAALSSSRPPSIQENAPGGAAEASFGIVIGVDAAGRATFSIAGVTTSSYLIQSSEPGDAASADVADLARFETSQTGLIVPAAALSGLPGVSVALSQPGYRGELTVMVNYN